MSKLSKNCILVLISSLICLSLFGCNKFIKAPNISVNGEKYSADLVKSGYYLDKASMSDALLAESLEQTEVIEKPASLGVVELPDFSTIELTNNKKVDIDDTAISAEIERIRDTYTTYTPVKTKRAAKLTDKVKIDFKGYVNGEELEGGSGDDYELILGSNQFIPGFEDKVVGHTAGSKFSIDLVFPENYTEELANKPVKFDIVIKSMEEAETPAVDEEFIKKNSKTGATTLEEYRVEIKKKLEDNAVFMNNQNLIYQLYDKLTTLSKCEPTEEALAWNFSVVMDSIKQNAKQQGMTLSELLTSGGGTVKDAYDEIKQSMPQYLSSEMIIEELKKKYKVEVSEDDVKESFSKMTEAMGFGSEMTYDDYIGYVGYDNVKSSVEQEKVLLMVVKDCKVVDDSSNDDTGVESTVSDTN